MIIIIIELFIINPLINTNICSLKGDNEFKTVSFCKDWP